MDSLTKASSSLSPFRPLLLPTSNSRARVMVRFSVSSSSSSSSPNPNPIAKPLRSAAAGCLLLTALLSGRLSSPLPAIADPVQQPQVEPETNSDPAEPSSDTADSLGTLPLRHDTGDTESDTLSFEALFENALLTDRDAALLRLESALETAGSERDARLVAAQARFLREDVDGALRMYEELAREDPEDRRPWFCQGVIYSLTGRNEEARERFDKYKELAPNEFEVDAYLQSPLSRTTKLVGNEDS